MRYITVDQYRQIKDIPRGRLASRFIIYAGGIIVKDSKILLCKSRKKKYPGWQLPGGKVLWSEKILECLKREILEETGYITITNGILGIYQRDTGPDDEEYMRIIFHIKSFRKKKDYDLDPMIEKTKWFDIDYVLNDNIEIQSKQILREIKEYTEGIKYPLDVLQMYKW
jgi:ADP-ribose pyrophosphatase YjhB (NUDIX family)